MMTSVPSRTKPEARIAARLQQRLGRLSRINQSRDGKAVPIAASVYVTSSKFLIPFVAAITSSSVAREPALRDSLNPWQQCFREPSE